MLLSPSDRLKFIELYPVTSTSKLCEMYHTNTDQINNMARKLGIYKNKMGKFSFVRNRT